MHEPKSVKNFALWFLANVSVRSFVIVGLLVGSLYLAIADTNFRPHFADLAKIGLGGYLAQLIPKKN